MKLLDEIRAYQPCNAQEEADRAVMLDFMEKHDDCLLRSNLIAHFTASIWTVNKDRTKTLMVYHRIYDSWSWIGGHADGEEDLKSVALRELCEETGVKNSKLVSDGIFSLEVLTVDGHIKRGQYVPSHLHVNVTYLAEADEDELLTVKKDENTGVRWFENDEALKASTEPLFVENVYKKLMEKCK